MLDFMKIETKIPKKDVIEIYPNFLVIPSKDLMIRGGDFYAIWDQERGIWSTDQYDVVKLVDKELDAYKEKRFKDYDGVIRINYMWDSSSGSIDRWIKYCKKQVWDSFHILDENLVFLNTDVKKEDYASKRLPYPLERTSTKSYDLLMNTLYDPTEKHKIEWAIGSIISGDSKYIQKFIVLYGSAGTGKSTVLNIIQELFKGYYSVFDAKALGSAHDNFALEPFKTHPLVAIQHDGDLSKIEDNTRLNSLTSHEEMSMNEKFKSAYSARFRSFLFMGTNKPVKITDSKSGLLRRLIDVSPSGRKLERNDYDRAFSNIKFELGGIATHCLDVYLEDPKYYDDYIPVSMIGATNDFYNFISDYYIIFDEQRDISLKIAWEYYKEYCSDANIQYPYSKRAFQEELKNYFSDFKERHTLADGTRVRNCYINFLNKKFEKNNIVNIDLDWLTFESQESIFDDKFANCPAQKAEITEFGDKPKTTWANCRTKLKDICTGDLHYVKPPESHIVVDFDIPDENGNKSLELNLNAANTFPETYAELSKSGQGIHLHYMYTGDPSELNHLYDTYIEIKTFTGGSSLRRKLTKCNNLQIATISSGLPKAERRKNVVDFNGIKSQDHLNALIRQHLNKKYGSTKQSIDFIDNILNEAYASKMTYTVESFKPKLIAFAANSSNNAQYCLRKVSKMKLKSDDAKSEESYIEEAPEYPGKNALAEPPIVFFDIESYPNLFVFCWKYDGDNFPVVKMFNPKAIELEPILKNRLIGFNNRMYDNHMVYGRMTGDSIADLYKRSQGIIMSKTKNEKAKYFFPMAYNLSYTDIYDFSSKKQSLKKWEIELGIHHMEMGIPWDKPVEDNLWSNVGDYCANDVLATEAVFHHLHSDFIAREILADLAEGDVNMTTNALTTKIVFGNDAPKHGGTDYNDRLRKWHEAEFNYRNMGFESDDDIIYYDMDSEGYVRFNAKGQPVFPGYTFSMGQSMYRGEDPKEGGYVYAEPGMYQNVGLYDIQSMHPNSLRNENHLGKFTKNYTDILDARVAIKHNDTEHIKTLLDGKLVKYMTGDYSLKDLSQALKIAINSVYGLTSASFPHEFHDERNVDNIIAKRGALFMINLKHYVQSLGYTVAHIKTDSIKVPNCDAYIEEKIMEFGKLYGYLFEHEATYEKLCLVNDSTYIAKDATDGTWTATGTQFKVPYVFKSLFSKEPITWDDYCMTNSVKTAIYLDFNECLPDVSLLEYEKARRKKDKAPRKKDPDYLINMTDEELDAEIAKGHSYTFIGRVGSFVPVKSGTGGGMLMKDNNVGEKVAVTGSTGYRWEEAEMARSMNHIDNIDRTYFDKMVNDAVHDISQYGDFEAFAN